MPQDATPPTARQSRLISKVLSPAVRLWLRSQVEAVEDLHFQIEGGDRQILSGYLPKVTIAARKAIYQGIHLSQVQLTAEEIRINLGQVLKGKPLRLLSAVPVCGEVAIHQSDLESSRQSPLVLSGLRDLLTLLLSACWSDLPPDLVADLSLEQPWFLQQPLIQLGQDQMTLGGTIVTNSRELPLAIRSGIGIQSGSRLCLFEPVLCWAEQRSQTVALPRLHQFEVDLGSEVALQTLLLNCDRLFCQGRINIQPTEAQEAATSAATSAE